MPVGLELRRQGFTAAGMLDEPVEPVLAMAPGGELGQPGRLIRVHDRVFIGLGAVA
jgi:hypothetical protein